MFLETMIALAVQVFKHYFEELEEESLRDNFVVVVSKFGSYRNCSHFMLALVDGLGFTVLFILCCSMNC